MDIQQHTVTTRFCQRFSVGLTGGIASGKSTVANVFNSLGAAVVDTDVIAHQLTAGESDTTPLGAAMPAIVQAFGSRFTHLNGGLNRALMREHMLNNPEARLCLESILHPMINHHAQMLAHTLPGVYVVFVVPLLIESHLWHTQVDRILVVDCDRASQQQRLLQRTGITALQANQLLAIQATREERLMYANDTVKNDGLTALEQLQQQVYQLHQVYLNAFPVVINKK